MPPEEKHVLSVLKTTMRVLGYSNRDLERKLKLSGSYLSRLFSGDLDLRFSHILDLSRAMGLAPEEMLRLVYPSEPGPKSPAAKRLEGYLQSLRAPTEPGEPGNAPKPTRQEIEMGEAIEAVLSGMLEKLGPVALFGDLSATPAVPAMDTAAAVDPPEPSPAPLPAPPRRKRRSRKES